MLIITYHSSLITYHLKYPSLYTKSVWHHLSIFFNYLWVSYLLLGATFTFFLFFLQPPVPKLTKHSGKKKKKNPKNPKSLNLVKKKKFLKILTESSKKNKNKKTYWRRPRPNVKGKRKRRRRRRSHLVWKKKGWRHQTHRTQWRRKKKESESKVAACGSLGVCLIMEMPLKIELWKLKTPKMCF